MSTPHQPAAACALSIVIPVYNESENIRPVTDEIIAAMAEAPPYEIVFVDDGSSDATASAVRQTAVQWPQVRLVSHERRAGKSTALVTGVSEAHGAWIATMDGDGQNDPDDALALFRAATATEEAGPLIVAGARRQRRDTWLKRISSRIANRVRARVLGDATPDTGCGLKVFRRAAFLELPRFENMHRFLPALFLMHGGRVVSMPVADRPRAAGHSKYGFHNRLWVGIVDLLGVWWLKRRTLPPSGAEEVS